MDTMDSSTVAGLLHIISAAVTPVVMISACASLILTINSKHTNLSKQLLHELAIFQRRFMLTYLAHVALNIAVIVFVLCVIVIIFTQRRLFESGRPTLILFLGGTALMFVAMCCELIEISLSQRSMRAEMEDITPATLVRDSPQDPQR
jgi:hypothetical protein